MYDSPISPKHRLLIVISFSSTQFSKIRITKDKTSQRSVLVDGHLCQINYYYSLSCYWNYCTILTWMDVCIFIFLSPKKKMLPTKKKTSISYCFEWLKLELKLCIIFGHLNNMLKAAKNWNERNIFQKTHKNERKTHNWLLQFPKW